MTPFGPFSAYEQAPGIMEGFNVHAGDRPGNSQTESHNVTTLADVTWVAGMALYTVSHVINDTRYMR